MRRLPQARWVRWCVGVLLVGAVIGGASGCSGYPTALEGDDSRSYPDHVSYAMRSVRPAVVLQRMLLQEVERGYPDRVQYLLETSGIRPSATVLAVAKKKGNQSIIGMLEDRGVDPEASTLTVERRERVESLRKIVNRLREMDASDGAQLACRLADSRLDAPMRMRQTAGEYLPNQYAGQFETPEETGEALVEKVAAEIAGPLTKAFATDRGLAPSSVRFHMRVPGVEQPGWIVAGDAEGGQETLFGFDGERIGTIVGRFTTFAVAGPPDVTASYSFNDGDTRWKRSFKGTITSTQPMVMAFTYEGTMWQKYRDDRGRANMKVVGEYEGSGEFQLSSDGATITGFLLSNGSSKTTEWAASRYNEPADPFSFSGRWKTSAGGWLDIQQPSAVRETELLMLHAAQGEPAVAWGAGKVMYPEARYVSAIDTWMVRLEADSDTWAVRTNTRVVLRGIDECRPLPFGLNAALVRFGDKWGAITSGGEKLGAVEHESPEAVVRMLREAVLRQMDGSQVSEANTPSDYLMAATRARALSACFDSEAVQRGTVIRAARALVQRFGSVLALVYLRFVDGALDRAEPYLSALGWNVEQVSNDAELIEKVANLFACMLPGRKPADALTPLPPAMDLLAERRGEPSGYLAGDREEHYLYARLLRDAMNLALTDASDSGVRLFARRTSMGVLRGILWPRPARFDLLEPIYRDRWIAARYSSFGDEMPTGLWDHEGRHRVVCRDVTTVDGELRLLVGLAAAPVYDHREYTAGQVGEFCKRLLDAADAKEERGRQIGQWRVGVVDYESMLNVFGSPVVQAWLDDGFAPLVREASLALRESMRPDELARVAARLLTPGDGPIGYLTEQCQQAWRDLDAARSRYAEPLPAPIDGPSPGYHWSIDVAVKEMTDALSERGADELDARIGGRIYGVFVQALDAGSERVRKEQLEEERRKQRELEAAEAARELAEWQKEQEAMQAEWEKHRHQHATHSHVQSAGASASSGGFSFDYDAALDRTFGGPSFNDYVRSGGSLRWRLVPR